MVDSTRASGSDDSGSLGDLVLGIDAGTSACKAVVWDLHGNVVTQGRASLSLLTPRPQWHEQLADDWWAALVAAVNSALVGHRQLADRIVALCIAPQRETFVPVDTAGRPLRNAIVWMDERSRELLPGIAAGYGGERIHQTTGKPLSGNLAPGKIRWLQRYEPKVFARTHKFLDVAAFLNHMLTGLYRTGWGCVDPMGLFDMRENAWSESLLGYLGISIDQMPEVCPTGSVIGELTEPAAEACGLQPGTAVVAGVGDGQSGGLGANITEPGKAYLSLGTSVVSGTTTEDYVVDRAFRTMTGGVPGTYSLETVLLGGTYTVDWLLDKLLGCDSAEARAAALDRYDAALDTVPLGAEGLMVVPYWNSAMNPYWDAGAGGITVGWRGNHTPEHLYRAVLEGIAYEQRLHTEGVEAALGRQVEAYVAMGGGAQSARWCRIIADVTGRPLLRAVAPESAASSAAALGAGILAAFGSGLYTDVREAASAMTRLDSVCFVPDVERHARYDRLYNEVYCGLFPALQGRLDRLTELTELVMPA